MDSESLFERMEILRWIWLRSFQGASTKSELPQPNSEIEIDSPLLILILFLSGSLPQRLFTRASSLLFLHQQNILFDSINQYPP
jgi:hypothetical protein